MGSDVKGLAAILREMRDYESETFCIPFQHWCDALEQAAEVLEKAEAVIGPFAKALDEAGTYLNADHFRDAADWLKQYGKVSDR